MKPLKLKKVCFRPAVDDKGFDIFCGEEEPIGYLCHIYPDGELELLKWLAQKQEVALMSPDSKIMGGESYLEDDKTIPEPHRIDPRFAGIKLVQVLFDGWVDFRKHIKEKRNR